MATSSSIQKKFISDRAIVVKALLLALAIHGVFAFLFKDGVDDDALEAFPAPGAALLDLSGGALSADDRELMSKLYMLDPTLLAVSSGGKSYAARRPVTIYRPRPDKWHPAAFGAAEKRGSVPEFAPGILNSVATGSLSDGFFLPGFTRETAKKREIELPEKGVYLDGKRLDNFSLPENAERIALEAGADNMQIDMEKTLPPNGSNGAKIRFSIVKSSQIKRVDSLVLKELLSLVNADVLPEKVTTKKYSFKVRFNSSGAVKPIENGEVK